MNLDAVDLEEVDLGERKPVVLEDQRGRGDRARQARIVDMIGIDSEPIEMLS